LHLDASCATPNFSESQMIEIRNWYMGEVIYTVAVDTLKGANLEGSTFRMPILGALILRELLFWAPSLRVHYKRSWVI
jgi:hypothetical protein